MQSWRIILAGYHFSNLCLSCIFKRSNYCATELVASFWSCMGKNQWIPWSCFHCHISSDVIIKLFGITCQWIKHSVNPQILGPDKALLAWKSIPYQACVSITVNMSCCSFQSGRIQCSQTRSWLDSSEYSAVIGSRIDLFADNLGV